MADNRDMKDAVGLIEVVGLAAAVRALDAALKSADVRILGVESARGGGQIVIKLGGTVSAVESAVKVSICAAEEMGACVHASRVIPRPAEGLAQLFWPGGRDMVDIAYQKKPKAAAVDAPVEKSGRSFVEPKPAAAGSEPAMAEPATVMETPAVPTEEKNKELVAQEDTSNSTKSDDSEPKRKRRKRS